MRPVFSLLLALGAVAAQAAPPTLEVRFTVDGLSNPESVVEADDGTLFVSNVAGEGAARDGNGFVARVSADGRLLQREWLGGLHAPKGLVRRGGTLFASDVTELVEIDVAQARIVARHPVAGASFLNDTALAPDGTVLVSDSGSARIFAWDGRAMRVWLADERLQAVNGLLPEAEQLLVTTMQGLLLAVDWGTRDIRLLAEGLGDADGLVRLEDGSLLVGEWPGRLFHVVPGAAGAPAQVETILDGRAQKIYLNDFLRRGDTLWVPNWEPGTLTAYRLSH